MKSKEFQDITAACVLNGILPTHDNMFLPKMEMFLFGMKPSYFHITTFDVHYFLLANQLVWLSGQMRSSCTDQRGFPVFIRWEDIHIDIRLSSLSTRQLHWTSHRLRTGGRRQRVKGEARPRAAQITAVITSTEQDCWMFLFICLLSNFILLSHI